MTGVLRRLLPRLARRRLTTWWRALTRRPPVGRINFGDLRRLRPISGDWGFDRGHPIDRYYIDEFLRRHASDVHGRVLEVGTDAMTRAWGGDRVTQSDVLHVADSGPPVTIVSDLADGSNIPDAAFDCVIVTQTLQMVYDTGAAVRTLHRILSPGGVALLTVPGITRISRYDMDRWGQYWSFTSLSARRIFEEVFRPEAVHVEAFGNVLSAVALLHGVAADELEESELQGRDLDYEVLVAVRAQRAEH